MAVMLEENFSPRIDETYREQLLELAGGDTQLVDPFDNWLFADLPEQPGETIPYVSVGDGDRAVLLVPGFTEGILSKAPLAVDLARRGHKIIVPGQDRADVLVDGDGKKNATLSQAENLFAIMRAEELDAKPGSVHVVTHSYGSLIFETMHKLAQARELPCFDGASVVMLDPAGFIGHEWLLRLGIGFTRNSVAETFSEKDVPDSNGMALKAGIGYALANKSRTAREVWEISRDRLDYEYLLHSDIGRLAVLSYGQGRIFPTRAQRKTIVKMLSSEEPVVPVTWATPISLQELKGSNSRIRSRKGSTHNDDQFNPARVGGAVAQFL
jgi:hypothetical protein